jgi:hypothetical protein
MLGTPHTRQSDYQLFGLRLRSDIELPELFSAPTDGVPDVVVRTGEVREPEEGGLKASERILMLRIPGVGRYRIVDGHEIVIEPEKGAPERNVRLYLLGSAMGALLHQRGILPLHANAIEIDGQAVAFMGASGSGKSTLAAWFHDHGHRVIADDVCAITLDETGQAFVMPGLPRLRLWSEVLEATGRNASNFMRSYDGDEEYAKFDVPLAGGTVADVDLPLRAVYLLERGDGLTIVQMTSLEAAEALFAHTYRGMFAASARMKRRHWITCTQLLRNVPVFRVGRIWDLACLDDQGGQTLAHAQDLARSEEK